jgi:hypothetical protein
MRNDAPILAEAEAHIVFKADWRFIANFTRNIASNSRTEHGQLGERGSAKLLNGMQSNSRIEYGQVGGRNTAKLVNEIRPNCRTEYGQVGE